MFDAAPLCEGLLGEDSFYALLAEHGERIVSDADFAECYSQGTGRPSIPPALLAKLMLLQYREKLSDERAMEAVRLHLGWKVALGLTIDHPGFHPTTPRRPTPCPLLPAPVSCAPHTLPGERWPWLTPSHKASSV
ncbi:MAG: transposase [Solirubrobacterales bacterium]